MALIVQKLVAAGALLGAAAGLYAIDRKVSQGAAAKGSTAICTATPSDPNQLATIVARARTFDASLDASQRAVLNYPLNQANGVRWSNLPISAIPRVGVRFGTLDAQQEHDALALVDAAAGACGRKMFDDIRASDQFIRPIAPFFNWGRENFFIAILGTPSTNAPWMLKIGGHHLAFNFTYNGKLPGATPMFTGTEPIRFQLDGRSYEPLSRQSQAMSSVAQAIHGYPGAHLDGTFTDVVKGVEVSFPPPGSKEPPQGGNDTGYPSQYPQGATGRGVAYTRLTADQQRIVRSAMEAYANVAGSLLSKPLLATYQRPDALAQTYIGYSGSPDLSTESSYVRIDGPRLWMELVVQAGVAFPKKLHYHALWRDKAADYGGEFSK